MPVRVIDSSDRPTFVEHPNMRFATSALSHEYRDYAINGELLMDKITGEILIKRPADGRIMSFDQNKKYMHDLMLELRVLLTTNENFVYPGRKVEIVEDGVSPITDLNESEYRDAFYVSTNYDLVTINKEIVNDVLTTNNTIIPELSEEVDLRNTLSFNISGKTNGFFCKPITRDSDKAATHILSRIYNEILEDYKDTYQDVAREYNEYYHLESQANTFVDSDVIISYKVIVTEEGSERSYPGNGFYTDYIRFNEERCVQFPDEMMENFPNGFESAKVVIHGLTYHKMHYVMNNVPNIPELETLPDDIAEYLAPDGKVYVNYLHVGSFVDKYEDIALLGNDILIACVDVPYMHRYMQKMASLRQAAGFIQSSLRPDDIEWGSNALWAETVKNVEYNGHTVKKNSATDIKELETYIAKMNRVMTNFNPSNRPVTDIWVEEVNE